MSSGSWPARRGALLLDDLAGAAGGLDGRARGLGEAVRVDGQRLLELTAAQDLDGHVPALRQAGGSQRREVDRRARVEALLQVGQVDRLGVRPEHLERHRHLLVRPAQLAHAHVDRRLTALEARTVLGAGAGAVALVAAPGGLAVARARAAADALALLARPRVGLEVVQSDAHLSSTTIRWRTACSMPRSWGESGFSTEWPILRRPIERSVSRCLALAPLAERTCLITYVLMRRRSPQWRPAAPRRRPERRGTASRRPRRSPWRARAPRRPTGRAARRSPPACAAPAGRRSSP